MNRKLKAFVAVLIIVATFDKRIQAEPLPEGRQSYGVQVHNDEGRMQSFEDRRQEMERKIELLDSQIENLMEKINEDNKTIQQVELQITFSEEEIEKLEKNIEEETVLFNRRVRTMYMTGKDSYLEALLSARGISDFASKVEAIKNIMDYDKKIIASLNNKKADINKKKDLLNEKNQVLLKLITENEEKLKVLNQTKDSEKVLLDQIKSEQQAAQRQIDINTNINTDDILKVIQGSKDSEEKMSSDERKILSFAIKYLGVPYQWGGTSPSTGFDCSGFTQFVFGEFGIKLGRTTYDQLNDGKHISRAELRPGDLVLFGSGGNPHHAGIYVGNNCYIHSPRTGDVIRISSMDRGDFLSGVRVIKVDN